MTQISKKVYSDKLDDIANEYNKTYHTTRKSTHRNSLQKTNKYRLIDATLIPGNQVWSLVVVSIAAATTYSEEV